MADGIFTQPGPDGLFGRGGEPLDASAPPIDSDGTPLKETLVAVFPSPGHMRVARATRHPKTGKVEFQEQYRVPTPEEVTYLKSQGIGPVGAGSMVPAPGTGISSGTGALGDPTAPPDPSAPAAPPAPAKGFPWGIAIGALVVGAAGLWAANKYVVPLVSGDDKDKDDGADDVGDDEGDDD